MNAQDTRQAAQAPETLFDQTNNSRDSYVIALDQGTTSSRAVLVDRSGAIRAITQSPFPQIFPHPGWVEHDPKDILSSQLKVLTELLVSQGLSPEDIDSIGITNQRETTIVWNRHTGEPVHNAIVWQCRRTAEAIDELKQDETIVEEIRSRTGLIPDAYFSASKIAWILDNVEGAREAAQAGDLLFGTVDTWLIWNLTQGRVHATDYTNARCSSTSTRANGMGGCASCFRSRKLCFPKCGLLRAISGERATTSCQVASRLRGLQATSRRHSSVSAALRQGKRNRPSAPGASCS